MENTRISTCSLNQPFSPVASHSAAQQSPTSETSLYGSLLPVTVDRCFSRVRRWSPPLNWASGDWQKELLQIAWLAALEGERDFKPIRGIAFEAFGYNRIRSGSRTCYRREGLHSTRVISEAMETVLNEDGR